jgi:hypothetical protein
MTTPTTSLGMSHIQTEFGGSNPISLSEYYGVNANVASSGAIRMAQFLGITNFAASTEDLFMYAYTPSGTSTASFFMRSNGQYTQQATGSSDANATWKTGGGTGSDYDCKLTITSTDKPTGASYNTWLNMASTYQWSISQSQQGAKLGYGHLEIRLAASPFTVLDNSIFQMDVEQGT